MREKSFFLIFCLSLVILVSGSVLSFYPYGTAPQGMGGAYSAVGRDIAAIYYNPASLNPPLLFETGLFTGFYADEVNLENIMRLGNMFTGFDPKDFDPDDLDIGTQRVSVHGLGGFQFNIPVISLSPAFALISDHELSFANKELIYTRRDEYIINARYTLLSPPLNLMAITVGGNAKILSGEKHRYFVVTPDPLEGIPDAKSFVDDETLASGEGFGVDVGLIFKATDMLTIGLSARDLINTFAWDNEDLVDSSMSFRGGAAIRVPLLALTLSGDIENFGYDGERFNRLHGGVEKGFLFNTIVFRGGLYTQPEKNEDEMIYTYGLGLNILAVKANLSMISQGLTEFKGFSLSAGIRF